MRNSTATIELNPAARQAIKNIRDAKPWRGPLQERADKFATLHREMCRAYDLETMLVRDDAFDPECTGTSGGSFFNPLKNKIVLMGRLSVVTYLFLLGLATGAGREAAMQFAHEQFRHFFPRSFARCRLVDGLLIKVVN